MSIEELIIEGKKHIHSHEAKMLLASVLNYDNLELTLHLDEEVTAEKANKYRDLVKARKDNYPLQYILGDVNFYGRRFIVNENVLIPRFETEELVEKTILKIKELFGDQSLKILDIGTGSGVIGITLKAELQNTELSCSDISMAAIELAQSNAKELKQEINFIVSDLFTNIKDKYDVIISNPPYIDCSEELEEQVFLYEPHQALYAKEQGTEFYREILKQSKEYLSERYLISFEIGSEQKRQLKALQEQYFPEAQFECLEDLSNRDRIVLIYKT